MPHGEGVTLALAKFNRILGVDPLEAHGPRAMRRAQPRHPADRCAPRPLLTRPTPASQIACTIGGNVAAENSGACTASKYGLTLQ